MEWVASVSPQSLGPPVLSLGLPRTTFLAGISLYPAHPLAHRIGLTPYHAQLFKQECANVKALHT